MCAWADGHWHKKGKKEWKRIEEADGYFDYMNYKCANELKIDARAFNNMFLFFTVRVYHILNHEFYERNYVSIKIILYLLLRLVFICRSQGYSGMAKNIREYCTIKNQRFIFVVSSFYNWNCIYEMLVHLCSLQNHSSNFRIVIFRSFLQHEKWDVVNWREGEYAPVHVL